jgi:hypothetical protein
MLVAGCTMRIVVLLIYLFRRVSIENSLILRHPQYLLLNGCKSGVVECVPWHLIGYLAVRKNGCQSEIKPFSILDVLSVCRNLKNGIWLLLSLIYKL